MLKDTVKKRLGYMVKNEREHLRLSQSALAEQAGVSIRTCNGNPELATLIPLAQYLKISLDAIIHEAPLETDHTTYQIPEELQNCSEEDRLIALRTLRELLAALKEKDQINKPHF